MELKLADDLQSLLRSVQSCGSSCDMSGRLHVSRCFVLGARPSHRGWHAASTPHTKQRAHNEAQPNWSGSALL